MSREAQNYANHAKFVPAFHYFAVPILMLALGYFTWQAVRSPSPSTVAAAVFALAVLVVAFLARLFALGVQDRVIRLEERLRLQTLLPEEDRTRISDLSTDHLIGLRFASDDEIPGLVRRVLAGELTDRKAIKMAVRDWRADHQRI